MPFRITHEDSACRARTGLLALRHGTVTTPAFMPVGTNATVKAMTSENLEALGVNLILCNAYHLYLRPGKHLIERAGGLHRFMSWKHNILTDSGGFQIFSLAPLRKIEKEGVCFRSHVDGSLHRLTPEDCLALQCSLGSDVLMPLDVCTPYGIPQQEALDASTTTTQWAVRTLSAWQNHDSSFKGELFGIIQGNFYADLRRRSADEIVGLDFAGNAIGGLSVGEPQEMFIECLESCAALTPKHKPLYVMGIGTPEYILEAVERGVDLFDCVLPTRTARNGQAFTRRGPLSLRNSPSASDFGPIDAQCCCPTCRNYSRSYLRHLFKAKEICASILATQHNLFFIQSFLEELRRAICCGDFVGFKRRFLKDYAQKAARGSSDDRGSSDG